MEVVRLEDVIEGKRLFKFENSSNLTARTNNAEQTTKSMKFSVNDDVSVFDWYGGHILLSVNATKKTDVNANAEAGKCAIPCGNFSFIKNFKVLINGSIVYNVDSVNQVIFIRRILEQPPDNEFISKSELWSVDKQNPADASSVLTADADTNPGFGARVLSGKNIMISIPLRNFAFFRALKYKILPPMDIDIEVEFGSDGFMQYSADASSSISFNQGTLFLKKLKLKAEVVTELISSFSNEQTLSFHQEQVLKRDQGQAPSFTWQASPGVIDLKHAFFFMRATTADDATNNPYLFTTFDEAHTKAAGAKMVSFAKLIYGNGNEFPDVDGFKMTNKFDIFQEALEYSGKWRTVAGEIAIRMDAFFQHFGFFYFDLRSQPKLGQSSSKAVTVEYKWNDTPANAESAFLGLIFEKMVVLRRYGGKIVIVKMQ